MTQSTKPVKTIIPSSGNVFQDLGFPDAAERQTKIQLAVAIQHQIEKQKLTQAEAAAKLDVSQPKVSALRHYRLDGFSVECLMNFLTALDQDVEIIIRAKPRSKRAARIVVKAA